MIREIGYVTLLVAQFGCATAKSINGKPEACDSPLVRELRLELQSGRLRGGEFRPKRSAIGVLAFPRSEQELREMNQMTVLEVRAFASASSDLPLSAALYSSTEFKPGSKVALQAIRDPGGIRVFPQIFPRQTIEIVKDPSIKEKLGEFTVKSYYFVPVETLKETGVIAVRFNDRVSTLPVISLPARLPDGLREISSADPDPGGYPDPKKTIELINRELCWPESREEG